MKSFFVLVLCLSAGFAARGDEPKKAPEALKGQWKLVSYTHTGQELPLDLTKSSVTFTDATMKLVMASKDEKNEAPPEVVSNYSADDKADPRTLDVSPPDRKFVAKAIWKVEKDRLTIVFAVGGQDRPKDFTPSNKNSVLVLERAKK